MADKVFKYKVLVDNPTMQECYTATVTGVEHVLGESWLLIKGSDGRFSSFPVHRVVQFDRVPVEQE